MQRKPELLQRTIEALKTGGNVRALATEGPETAGGLAREEIARGARIVAVLGGDGTINEAANGMIGSDVPLAPLSGGTANVLCVEVGCGTNPVKAASRLAHDCEPVRIAVGRMQRPDGFKRHFLLMAGVGFDAIVLDSVNPALKAALGKVAYWLSGFSVIGKPLPQFRAETHGPATQRSFALASRVRNYGGDLEIARNVTLLDPCFETVLFEGDNTVRYLSYMAGVLARQVEKVPGVEVAPATWMSCAPENGDQVPVQLDGERAGFLPARFDVVPEALTLMLPSEYVRRARGNRWITSPIH